MSELHIPEQADRDETRTLVRDFVDVGSEVEVHDPSVLKGETNRLTGEVVAIEDEFIVIDAGSVSNDRIEYGDLERITTVSGE